MSAGRSGRAARLLAPLLAVAAAIFGCADLGTDPAVAVAVEFDSIPYPSVLTGDTLRDSLGVAAPLRAIAYNSAGAVIANAPFQYFTLDTGVVIDASGFLTATRRDGIVRLVASISGLQTPRRTIQVTRRPDTVFTAGDTVLALNYILPDAAANLAPEMRLTLHSTDTVGVGPGVRGWLVRWRTVHAGDTLAPGDTTLVALQTGAGRRSALDTTATDGTSLRRLRVFANRLTTAVDSFVVVAEVKLHGVPVPGSPLRFVINIAPTVP